MARLVSLDSLEASSLTEIEKNTRKPAPVVGQTDNSTSNIPADFIPTNINDFYIWDRQMLNIFSRLLQKVELIKNKYGQLPNEILRFSNYKDQIDATKYGGWSIEIDDPTQLVSYLEKQIELYKKQILLNNRDA